MRSLQAAFGGGRTGCRLACCRCFVRPRHAGAASGREVDRRGAGHGSGSCAPRCRGSLASAAHGIGSRLARLPCHRRMRARVAIGPRRARWAALGERMVTCETMRRSLDSERRACGRESCGDGAATSRPLICWHGASRRGSTRSSTTTSTSSSSLGPSVCARRRRCRNVISRQPLPWRESCGCRSVRRSRARAAWHLHDSAPSSDHMCRACLAA